MGVTIWYKDIVLCCGLTELEHLVLCLLHSEHSVSAGYCFLSTLQLEHFLLKILSTLALVVY